MWIKKMKHKKGNRDFFRNILIGDTKCISLERRTYGKTFRLFTRKENSL